MNESGTLSSYVGQYAEVVQGMKFLIINMTLENHGYTSFSVNPNYFAVVIDNVANPYDKATYSTKNPLSTPTLLDGGKICGYLVFQIPKGQSQYRFRYIGSGDYHIIYGDLVEAQTQVKQEPKLPVRNISFNLGDGIHTITTVGQSSDPLKDELGNLLSRGGKSYWTTIDASQTGHVDQKTNIKLSDEKGSDQGSIDISIKTFTNQNIIPADTGKAIQDEISKAIGNNKQGPSHEALFSNVGLTQLKR